MFFDLIFQDVKRGRGARSTAHGGYPQAATGHDERKTWTAGGTVGNHRGIWQPQKIRTAGNHLGNSRQPQNKDSGRQQQQTMDSRQPQQERDNRQPEADNRQPQCNSLKATTLT